MKPQRTATVAPIASNTKRKLIEAAHALIWANSYSQVSVEDICRAAGVQKGSFYHFFPGKADLAAAALEDKWQNGCQVFDQIFVTHTTARAQLHAVCKEILAKQKSGLAETGAVCGCPYATLASEMSGDHDSLFQLSEKMSESFRGHYERILKNAVKEKLIPAAGIGRTARAMHAYCIGAMMQARLTNSLTYVGRDMEDALLRLSGLDVKPLKTVKNR
jgi:TetR/AcrR family transcriptional repressor of nem operon